jgi:hypothetical protein
VREKSHLEDMGTDGRILLKLAFEKPSDRAVTGLLRLRSRHRWRALVNIVTKCPVHKMREISCVAEELYLLEKECCTELLN